MKLCTFTHDGKTRTGIVAGDSVIDTDTMMRDRARDRECKASPSFRCSQRQPLAVYA